MIGTAVNEGSPGDDKWHLFFTSRRMKHRASQAKGVPWEEWTRASTIKERQPAVVGLEPAAPVEAGLQDGETKTGFHGKTHPTAYGHVKKERPKLRGRRKGFLKAMKRLLSRN